MYGYLRGDQDRGRAGGGIEYEHRIHEDLSAWARGEAGYGWGELEGWQVDALGGLRWRW